MENFTVQLNGPKRQWTEKEKDEWIEHVCSGKGWKHSIWFILKPYSWCAFTIQRERSGSCLGAIQNVMNFKWRLIVDRLLFEIHRAKTFYLLNVKMRFKL